MIILGFSLNNIFVNRPCWIGTKEKSECIWNYRKKFSCCRNRQHG